MDLEDVPCIDSNGVRQPTHDFTMVDGRCYDCDLPADAYIEPYYDDETYDYWE